jgi:cytochrome c oxidase subunit 3
LILGDRQTGCILPTLTARARDPQTGGGGRGPIDRHDHGGGGGGGRGDGPPDYAERLRRCRLGIAIALVGVVTLFVAFTMAFLVRGNLGTWDPAAGTYIRDWIPVHLPLRLLSINTVVLVLSSITLELARRQTAESALLAPLRSIGIAAMPRHVTTWLGMSIALGLFFLAGQTLVWRMLATSGLDLHASSSTSFFYVLTAAHAVHLVGGLLALIYAGVMSALSKPVEVRHIVVDVTTWYWHVMCFLWLYVFALLALSSQ